MARRAVYPPPRQAQPGYAMPLAVGASGVLMLLSLTLHGMAMQERLQVGARERVQREDDLLVSAAHQLLAALNSTHPCLRVLPLAHWPAASCASPAAVEVKRQARRAAQSSSPVLLLGETGVGKEIFAQRLHEVSPRAQNGFLQLNCAAFTDTLLESELFGHAKGAFRGASYHKQGLVDAANGGALFPDEIGDIPSAQQVKLLRLIETATYR